MAVVMDLYSRKIIGWTMTPTMTTKLVLGIANGLAVSLSITGLLLHSDRSSQYVSREYQALLDQHGIVCSISRKGKCWDTQSMMSSERLPNLTRAGIGQLPLR